MGCACPHLYLIVKYLRNIFLTTFDTFVLLDILRDKYSFQNLFFWKFSLLDLLTNRKHGEKFSVPSVIKSFWWFLHAAEHEPFKRAFFYHYHTAPRRLCSIINAGSYIFLLHVTIYSEILLPNVNLWTHHGFFAGFIILQEQSAASFSAWNT